MEELRNIYKKRFFARRNSMNWRAPIFADAVIEVFNPISVIDVGCATGDIIAELINRSVYAYGIEGSDQVLEFLEIPKVLVCISDLRLPINQNDFPWGRPTFLDLCMSLEVAEHIEPEYCDQYLDNLILLSNKILLTAAPPGQGGHHHVNCQSPVWWEARFLERNFREVEKIETQFKDKLKPWAHKKGIKAYYNNVMYFEKEI